MSDVLQQDLISYDPLSEVTRRERRSLLGLSMLGLALVWVPLVPTKFAAFGIEFAEVNRKAFVLLYALLVLYYLVAFLVYALSDFVAWRRSEIIRYSADERAQNANPPKPPPERNRVIVTAEVSVPQHFVKGNPVYRGFASWAAAVIASRLRAAFEFGLPIVFACVALYALISYRPA